MKVLKDLASLLYIVNPYETMFKSIYEGPRVNQVHKMTPYFIIFFAIEQIASYVKRDNNVRLNNRYSSLGCYYMMMARGIIFSGSYIPAYIYIYDNYRIIDLPYDSLMTWLIGALAVDLAYYWWHRMQHEVNILWAFHQIHHNSEDYDSTLGTRGSIFQFLYNWIFYLPWALFVSPSLFLVHMGFSVCYQFWIHSDLLAMKMVPFDYIFNTAKHHKLHHGSNRFCIDKNYAGVLIIWDRLLGTFQEQKEGEEVVLGLIEQPQYFNSLKHQIYPIIDVWKKAQSMDNWTDWLFAFIKGPGWVPGGPRLGDVSQIPEGKPRPKYDPKVPLWLHVYTSLHFLFIFVSFEFLQRQVLGTFFVYLICIYLTWTITSIGMLYDKSSWCWPNEIIRCATFLILSPSLQTNMDSDYEVPFLITKIIIWVSLILSGVTFASSLNQRQHATKKFKIQ